MENLVLFLDATYTRAALRLSSTFQLDKLLPSLIDAAEQFLIPALSAEFFDDLTDSTVTDADALRLTKQALAHLAAALYAETGAVAVTASGIQEVSGGENLKPSRIDLLTAFIASQSQTGHRKVERLLAYLEKNADDFPVWRDSDAFTLRTEFPVSGVDEFERHVSIGKSRRAFLALVPSMQRTMDRHLTPVLEDLPTGLSDAQKTEVQRLTKSAFCHLTAGYGLPDIAALPGPLGQVAPAKKGDELLSRAGVLLQFGKDYLAELVDYADGLTPPAPGSVFQNDPKSKVFGVF